MKATLVDLHDRMFWISKEAEIKSGETTDVYFKFAAHALRRAGINPRVVMEVYTRSTPYSDNWGVASGIFEVAKLLEGLPVDVDAVEEGEIFLTDSHSVIYEPIIQVFGHYLDFAVYENPILGFVCSSTAISTKSARMKIAAGGKSVLSFGTRRAHPALAPFIERASYIGGIDSVSNVLGARLLGQKPVGTMPHAFIICVGDERTAWQIFDREVPPDVPRIALIDTFSDEKVAAILAFETLDKNLSGVRLDTPSSRRGDLKKIIEEVKWELELRGATNVKIYVSGGLDEESVKNLSPLVDGFGVGTSISAAPVIDFGGKIVEVIQESGKSIYRAKRGDISGRKFVFRKDGDLQDVVAFSNDAKPEGYGPLLKPLIRAGKIVRNFETPEETRHRVLKNLELLQVSKPSLRRG
jgi:nicotinate phosphoribosyltransferase